MYFYKNLKSIKENFRTILNFRSIWLLSIKIELHRFYLNLSPVKVVLPWVLMWVYWQTRYKRKTRTIKMSKFKNLLKCIPLKNNILLKHTKKVKMITMKLLKKEGRKSCFSKTKFLRSIMKTFLTWVALVVKVSLNFVKKTNTMILSKDKDKKIWD